MPLASKKLTEKLHLILVNTPGLQDINDFLKIKKIIERTAPNIRVFTPKNTEDNPRLIREASLHPTLVVSPVPLKNFKPLRGRIHQGSSVSKVAQLEKLEAMSMPIPKWTIAGPDFRPKNSEWGDVLIIKTSYPFSAHGQAVSIVATDKYEYTPKEAYPEGHLGREWPMLVQQFIDTGEYASHYRVLTLYGEAIYCAKNTLTKPAPDLASIGSETVSDAIATNVSGSDARTLELVSDSDVLELANCAHAVFPEIPAKGIDIVRDHRSGKLYILELNCYGAVWHISSNYFRAYRVGEFSKPNIVAQFGAWEVAAKVLINRTRLDAL